MAGASPDFSELSLQVLQVLIPFPSGINLKSFWVEFEKVFKSPDPKRYGVTNRDDLLQHCSSCCIEERKGKLIVVKAKKKAKKKPSTDSGAENKKTALQKDLTPKAKGAEKENSDPPASEMPRERNHNYYGPPGPPPFHPRAANRAPRPAFQPPHPQMMRHPPPPQHHHRPSHQPRFTPQQLADSAEDCISRIAASKKLVSLAAIESHLLRDLEVLNVRELGLRNIDEIPVVREHCRAQCRVSTYIQAFVKVRSIATVYELEQNLRSYVNNNQAFEQLNLGPLVQQPLVSEYFKMPLDAAIPQLTTADVLEGLRDHLTVSQQWTSRETKIEDFLEFLCKKMKLETPFYLGLRMTSIGLAIGVLKKAQRECGQALRTSLGVMKSCTEADLERAYTNFKDTILSTSDVGVEQVRRQYLQMPSTKAVLQDFMQKALLLCKSVAHLANLCEIDKRSRRDLNRQTAVLEQFLGCLDSSHTLELMFAIAINCSKEDIRAQVRDLMELYDVAPPGERKESKSTDDSAKARPNLMAVVKEFRTFLERCMKSASLTLTHLNDIERKLLAHFDCKSFHSLTNSTFLEFLHDNKDVLKLLEDCGGCSLGASPRKRRQSTFLPCASDLFAFIQQAQVSDQKDVLERAVCYHYGAKDVSDLNHGSSAHLLKLASHQTHSAHDAVHYEAAVMAKSCESLFQPAGEIGRLGHRTRAEALACLQNCPLLEDMEVWSQWSLLFQAQFGCLKEFVLKYGGTRITPVKVHDKDMQLTTSFLGLEVRPGILLRITSDSSTELFKACADRLDARGASGHLASLITSNRGVQNTPLALLGNHVRMALFSAVETAPGGPSQSTSAVSFVLKCLELLPMSMALASANKVFLEPLSQVVGMSSSKELLLSAAQPTSQMHSVAILLGISEWNKRFLQRFQFPDQCMTKAETVDFGSGPCVILTESESESEEEEEDDDDDEDEEEEEEEEEEEVLEGMKEEEVVDLTVEDEVAVQTIMIEQEEEIETHEILSEKRAFIERIRREEFGIGLELTCEFQAVFEKNQARLGRSLQRLAHDLYSKDTHFVLELIQNADDNSYAEHLLNPDSDVVPTLSFVVSDRAVKISNNEKGFLEKHVKAICDVGCSTKPKHQMGYIGQKGIGFKSVFRVSDEPEIVSSGFHFKFDKNSSDMGYILPHWVNDEIPIDWSSVQGTQITLPFKEASSLANRSRFNDIHPNLLLFLNRLRKITLTIEPSAETEAVQRSMQRRDVGQNMVEIVHEGVIDQWLVVKKRLDASSLTKSENVEATEIALGFPVQSKEQLAAKVLPEKQLLFAFLPLRSYGFRFIVQGDFDLPSSREDVDHDSVWNQWLRSAIHTLFIDALNTFKSHANFDPIEGICRFLQFVPLEDEVLDFFRSVASEIIARLKRTACLPSAPIKSDVQWRLPSQLVAVRDWGLLREVISPQMLYDCLGLHYLHPAVLPYLSPALSRCLGVQSLNAQQLMDIGQALVKQMSSCAAEEEEENISRVAHWLACVQSVMEEEDFNADDSCVLQQLRQMAFLPAASSSGAKYVSVAQGSVFFPISSSSSSSAKKSSKSGARILRRLEQSVCAVSPVLLSCVAHDQLMHSRVCRLLEMLGVRKHTPRDLIEHHILPLLKNSHEVNADLLVAAVLYIGQQWDKDPNIVCIDSLRECIVLQTNHGMKSPHSTPIHFSAKYRTSGEMPNLAEEFPSHDWTLLDECYLQSEMTSNNRLKFFSELGVCWFISVRDEEKTLTFEEMGRSPWASLLPVLPSCDTFVIRDWACESLEHLIRCRDYQQMKNLFLRLHQFWEKDICQFAETDVRSSEGSVLKSGVTTTFGLLLKQSEWLPVLREECNEDEVSWHTVKVCCAAKDVSLDTEDVRKIYACHASYLDVLLPSPSNPFTRFLGLRDSVSPTDLRSALVQWSARLAASPGTPASFVTSQQHMRSVYTFLYQRLCPQEFRDLFQKHPVIFTARVTADEPSITVRGSFLSVSEVRWDDPTRLFRKYLSDVPLTERGELCRFSLCVIYDGMQQLFQSVGVEQRPVLSDYFRLLTHITRAHRQQDVLPDVLSLYATISTILGTMAPGERPMVELRRVLSKHSCIPTCGSSSGFVALTDSPMIPDDRNLQLLFRTEDGNYQPGVHLIETEQHFASQPKVYGIEDLMLELDVAKLSNCVVIETIPTQSFPDPRLQNYAAGVIECVRRLLFNFHKGIYAHFVGTGIVDWLLRLHFAQVRSLEMVYRLRHLPDLAPVVQEESCCMNREGFWLLRSEASDGARAQLKINRALAAFFSHGDNQAFKDIKNMLNEMIGGVEDMHKFCLEQNLDALPDHEAPWIIPAPREVPPSPEVQERQQPPQLRPKPDESVASCEGARPSAPPSTSSGIMTSWPPKSASITPLTGSSAPPPPPQWPMPELPSDPFTAPHSSSSAPPSSSSAPPSSSSAPPPGNAASHVPSVVSNATGVVGQPFAIHEIPPPAGSAVLKRVSSGHLVPEHGVKRPRPFIFQDAPHWLLDVDDPKSLYTDLSIDTLPPLDVTLADDQDRSSVAMWGELLVKSYLESEMAREGSGVKHVQWTSETDNPLAPFDFRVQMQYETRLADVFIEVKTTTCSQKGFCEFSVPELNFAMEKGEDFHLYRVFNAGDNSRFKLCKIENLQDKLTTKKIKLCLIV